jgi:hypothetical protein
VLVVARVLEFVFQAVEGRQNKPFDLAEYNLAVAKRVICQALQGQNRKNKKDVPTNVRRIAFLLV